MKKSKNTWRVGGILIDPLNLMNKQKTWHFSKINMYPRVPHAILYLFDKDDLASLYTIYKAQLIQSR